METKSLQKLFLGAFLILTINACLQKNSPSGAKGKKIVKSSAQKEASTTTSNSPTSNNVKVSTDVSIQSNGQNFTGLFSVNNNFNDSFYLRGQLVHDYLFVSQNRKDIVCLILHFPQTTPSSSTLLLAAISKSLNNSSANGPEYYYLIQATDPAVNKAACLKNGLINTLSQKYPGSNVVYAVKDVCPGCSFSVTSDPLELRTSNGGSISSINLQQLMMRLSGSGKLGEEDSVACSSAAECTSLGFNCCVEGQCVNDQQLRSDADTNSSDYVAAKKDIEANASNIMLYPQYYYICPISFFPTPIPTPPPSTELVGTQRLNYLKELFECIIPQQGEMGICTLKFENAQNYMAPSSPTPFSTDVDDRNFSSVYMGDADTSNFPNHSIWEIIYAEEILFQNTTSYSDKVQIDNLGSSQSTNDTLTDAQKVTVTESAPTDDSADVLKLRYKIDASCEYINSAMAKCQKFYVQGENLGKVTDHIATETKYLLPYYADPNRVITVHVDEFLKLEDLDWKRSSGSSQLSIEFLPPNDSTERGLDIYDQQVVKITFHVDLNNYPNIFKIKRQVLDLVSEMCDCNGPTCLLAPVKQKINGVIQTIDYACTYPTPALPPPPLQQTVMVNSKSAPLRYYDDLGQSHDVLSTTTPQQEGRVFKYKSSNLMEPNNVVDSSNSRVTIGFNEIYGSFSRNSTSATPPKMVRVVEGREYDIFVNSGVFSSCQECGTDYNSYIDRLFPTNFMFGGAGYTPDPTRTGKMQSNFFRGGNYRADDLLFGRACFVPATMIPWTQNTSVDISLQRKNRLNAQHFLFANGYQRDWYGFDYGSIIGSFDGVTWFAIGTQRRVRAKSNKLFLAVNAYFSDLTQSNNYSLTVTDTYSVPHSGSSITSDYNNDGAECQKYHTCETDSDCITQVGWDYTCQYVNTLSTLWPEFDGNGEEIANRERHRKIIEILYNFTGPLKRCIYRGRGAPCTERYGDMDEGEEENSFANTISPGPNGCLSNYYCQEFTNGSTYNLNFNKRIARYGKSPVAQNQYSSIYQETDTYGLGARTIGRPYFYKGDEKIDVEVRSQLLHNGINALCIPGRNSEFDLLNNVSLNDMHVATPPPDQMGDKISGIGVTPEDSPLKNYYGSCSILRFSDTDKKFTDYLIYNAPGDNYSSKLTDPQLLELKNLSASQALGTDLLKAFTNSASDLEIFTDSNTALIDKKSMQFNRCLRAPGSPCFSDLDCAGSSFYSQQILGLDESSSNYNSYEYDFWTQENVCGQLERPQIGNNVLNTKYDLKKNRCCRDIGKDFTIATLNSGSVTIETSSMAGVDLAISSTTRNSRMAPVYRDIFNGYAPLKVAPIDKCKTGGANCATTTQHPKNQFTTLHTLASRSCCSGNWVRQFATGNGDGKHLWLASKMQFVKKVSDFECLAWSEPIYNIATITFSQMRTDCADPANPKCRARGLSNRESEKYNNFLSSLELIGIPQVLIKVPNSIYRNGCNLYPQDAPEAAPFNFPIPGTINSATSTQNSVNTATASTSSPLGRTPYKGIPEYAEYDTDTSTNSYYYTGHDPDNFAPEKKQIFSPDKFTCCLPAGVTYQFDITSNMCCTGQKATNENRCCLRGYSNVSVYLNRYVSSEASHIDSSRFDPYTGAPDSMGLVYQLAMDKSLCCSGQVVEGKAVSSLIVPGASPTAKENKRWRFIIQETDSNVNFFNIGQRWNTNFYCAPSAEDNIPANQPDGGAANNGAQVKGI